MKDHRVEIAVLGAGPGGYAAAFHAADRGKNVVLVDQDLRLGGVCLNSGCIPSKALLHVTKLIQEAKASSIRGIHFNTPRIELQELRDWKESILRKLEQGLRSLAKKRGVELIRGRGFFESSQILRVETDKGQKFLSYDKAIIAVGSRAALPSTFDLGNKRIMTSTEALELEEIPQDLLVIGGGYIGLELGTVYSILGSRVVLVEAMDSILSGVDPDLARPVMKFLRENFKAIRLKSKVHKMATVRKKIRVSMSVDGHAREELYDRVLVSVGRAPNTIDLGLENTAVQKDSRGTISVNNRQETADPAIYAIGDVVGGAMLAHKASKEARVAVEAILGEGATFEDVVMPAVVFTDPEVAWCGLTETEAREKNIPVQISKFPWSASGRAMSFDRTDGLTKLILEETTDRILGVGIVGAGAGDLISEGVLAVEMGANARDLADTVHPHPTLSETLMEAAELFYGTSTHALARAGRGQSRVNRRAEEQ